MEGKRKQILQVELNEREADELHQFLGSKIESVNPQSERYKVVDELIDLIEKELDWL